MVEEILGDTTKSIPDDGAIFRCISCKSLIIFCELKLHELACEDFHYFCLDCKELTSGNYLLHK